MKASSRAAGAEIIPAELLEEFLVPVHDAHSAPHLRLRGVSPSSAYLSSRKEGRSSNLSLRCMTGLLFFNLPGRASRGRRSVPEVDVGVYLGACTTLPNKGMKQTSVEPIGRSQLIPGVGRA